MNSTLTKRIAVSAKQNGQRPFAEARCYAAHIARLQEQNRLLSECLADERRLRKQAYAWYQKRLQSRWWSLMDVVLLSVRHNDQAETSARSRKEKCQST